MYISYIWLTHSDTNILTDTHALTDTDTPTQTDTQTQKGTDRQTHKHRHRHRHTDTHTDTHTHTQAHAIMHAYTYVQEKGDIHFIHIHTNYCYIIKILLHLANMYVLCTFIPDKQWLKWMGSLPPLVKIRTLPLVPQHRRFRARFQPQTGNLTVPPELTQVLVGVHTYWIIISNTMCIPT